jgi:hypothetical protein
MATEGRDSSRLQPERTMHQDLHYLEARLRQAQDLELLATDISVRLAHRGMIDRYQVQIAALKHARVAVPGAPLE